MKGLFSNGVKSVVLDLLPEFERANGVMPVITCSITWASTNMLMDEIRKGAPTFGIKPTNVKRLG